MLWHHKLFLTKFGLTELFSTLTHGSEICTVRLKAERLSNSVSGLDEVSVKMSKIMEGILGKSRNWRERDGLCFTRGGVGYARVGYAGSRQGAHL